MVAIITANGSEDDKTSTYQFVRSAGKSLEHIFRSRMVFLERNHSETEIVSEKVLLSVTLGEPIKTRAYRFSL